MRYATVFASLAVGALIGAALAPFAGGQALLVWIGASFLAAALAYGGAGPRVIGKRPDGELPWWSLALNGPFLVLGLGSMRMVHIGAGEPPWTEVAPGILLGRRPTRRDVRAFRALGVKAVIDLCAELPSSRAMTGEEAYLLLPVLDSEAPSPEQLAAAVRWIDEHAGKGPLFVHCALGHSRSAMVIAAWRMAKGHAGGPDELEAELKQVRPSVMFTERQRDALRRWRRQLGLPTA
jgi:hypothetical protein